MHVLLAKAFGISTEETSFRKRGFHAPTAEIQAHLEKVGQRFLLGYHAALKDEPVEILAARLGDVEPAWQGFAFEGAAMALALQDRVFFVGFRSRFNEFLAGPGDRHAYMLHVGFGWALARTRWGIRRAVSRLDPLLRWLAMDGYGFHEGYFHFDRHVGPASGGPIFDGYWQRAFDQGLGRSMWFVMGTAVEKIARTIESLQESRRADFWSGVGLAATYAGGCDEENLNSLLNAAGGYVQHLGQGAAFAAKARQRAGNLTTHAQRACEILCGMSAVEAAGVCDAALQDLGPVGDRPAYEVWRRRIGSKMCAQTGEMLEAQKS